MTPVNRRTAIGLASLGVIASRLGAAQAHAHTIQTKPDDYRLQFFDQNETAVLDRVAEMILPADDHSPGAHEAKVCYYADLVAANSSDAIKTNWKQRLAAFQDSARQKYGKPFLELSSSEQTALVESLAAAEKNPSGPAEHFFADMKATTIFAYYSSPIGLLKELEYKGNQVLSAFPGCTDSAP
jgi:hypothetical protein